MTKFVDLKLNFLHKCLRVNHKIFIFLTRKLGLENILQLLKRNNCVSLILNIEVFELVLDGAELERAPSELGVKDIIKRISAWVGISNLSEI